MRWSVSFERRECTMTMRLPIDTSGLMLLVGMAPEPVVDFESRRPKADENGEPLYQLQVVLLGGEGAEVISVKVSGEPKGLVPGTQVRILGLVALRGRWVAGPGCRSRRSGSRR